LTANIESQTADASFSVSGTGDASPSTGKVKSRVNGNGNGNGNGRFNGNCRCAEIQRQLSLRGNSKARLVSIWYTGACNRFMPPIISVWHAKSCVPVCVWGIVAPLQRGRFQPCTRRLGGFPCTGPHSPCIDQSEFTPSCRLPVVAKRMSSMRLTRR
jgi:hypothetical protein